MIGANEYCKIFKKAEQIGRLYLIPSSHARGSTFRIYVLPAGEDVIKNGGNNPSLSENAVEVYGVTGSNPGWTETYGWLHDGKWRDDFKAIYEQRIAAIEKASVDYRNRQIEKDLAAEDTINDLLCSYS